MDRAKYDLNRYYARRAIAIEYLGGVCIECGTSNQLEFDHVDPSEKQFDVSEIMLHGDQKLFTELDKCVLRCKNHHVQRTKQQRGVPHGGGKTGKRNCKCVPCKLRKAEYMQQFRRSRKAQHPKPT